MSDLQELTNELMQDPEFKSEYEALQPEMDITRAILGVYSDNDRARHMYKKMGFKEYGMNPRAFKLKDGTYRDEIIMANIFE